MYRGMRKALLSTAVLALIVPAAQAKTGVIFDGDQTAAKPSQTVKFTVIAAREPRTPGREAKPIVGRKPLVTFRSASGRTIHVRASTTDLNGIAYGAVAFPDKGPWTTALQVGNRIVSPEAQSEPFPIGRRLPHAAPPPTPAQFPWVWVLSLGSIGSALLVLAMRHRGHWRTAS